MLLGVLKYSLENRFSQDMTVVDTELPYSVIDLLVSTANSIMATVLMCISAGYFAATVPPVILIVWVLQKYYLRTSRQIRLLALTKSLPSPTIGPRVARLN